MDDNPDKTHLTASWAWNQYNNVFAAILTTVYHLIFPVLSRV